MNKIRINRLFLAGLATFVIWIGVEILVERVLGGVFFGRLLHIQIAQIPTIRTWGFLRNGINILIALMNCTLLIWLYASLRPMYGVGTRTALIAGAFGFIFSFSMIINAINLGAFPLRLGLVEIFYEFIEFPLAMIAGAVVYEGLGDALPAT